MILHSQNSSQPRAVLPPLRGALYLEPWLENQMSPLEPLDFLRTWYNLHTVKSKDLQIPVTDIFQ